MTFGRRVAFWSAFPLLAPQGLWLRANATRLAPPEGPTSGRVGVGEPLSLLVLGDSVVAGVGASALDKALAGCFAEAVATRFARDVSWEAVGENGARIGDVVDRLLPDCAAVPRSIVLLSVGVNDVTGLTRTGAWAQRLKRLLDAMERRFSGPRVVVAGIPPLAHFPAIPQPLRSVLALRGRTFDDMTRAVCAARADCQFVATDLAPMPNGFAEDGYHPGPAGYRRWSQALAEAMEPVE